MFFFLNGHPGDVKIIPGSGGAHAVPEIGI